MLLTPSNPLITRARGNSSFAGRRVGGALDERPGWTPDDASVTTQASPYDQSTPVTASSRFPRSQSTLPRSSQPRGDERSALGVGYSAEFFFHWRRGWRRVEWDSFQVSSFRESNATFLEYSEEDPSGNIPRSLSNLNIDFACLENYSRWFNRRERSHMLFFLFFFFKYIVIIYLINLRNSEWSKVCFEDWTWFWSFFIEKSLDIRLEHAHSKSVVISNLFKDFSNYLIKRRVSKFNIIYINFIVFYCLWSTNDLAKSFMYYGNVKQWYR